MPNITNKHSHSVTPPIDEKSDELGEDPSKPSSPQPVNVKPIKKTTFKPSQIEQMNF